MRYATPATYTHRRLQDTRTERKVSKHSVACLCTACMLLVTAPALQPSPPSLSLHSNDPCLSHSSCFPPDDVIGKLRPDLLPPAPPEPTAAPPAPASGWIALPARRSSCCCVSCASSSIGSWMQLGPLLLLSTCTQHGTAGAVSRWLMLHTAGVCDRGPISMSVLQD